MWPANGCYRLVDDMAGMDAPDLGGMEALSERSTRITSRWAVRTYKTVRRTCSEHPPNTYPESSKSFKQTKPFRKFDRK